jgi:UDP-N-acetyl-D-glucosamine dehydrogenase
MRTLSYTTRMIELASEINTEMPEYVVNQVAGVLNENGIALSRSKVLVLGIAYKKDIDDLRESPALDIIQKLQAKGAAVSYHDPFCPQIVDDGHTAIRNLPMSSVSLTPKTVEDADVVLVVTDHSNVNYQMIVDNARAVVDTRGITRKVHGKARVVGLSGSLAASSAKTPVGV